MPIEIRELHIKAVIDGGKKENGEVSTNPATPSPKTEQNLDELAALVAEKVLEILKEQRER